MPLTPEFVHNLETRISSIVEREYARLTANLWWQTVTKRRPTMSKREVLTWLLSTAQIRDLGKGGNLGFEDIVSDFTEIESKYAGAGLLLKRAQLEDVVNGIPGGEGLDFAARWSADIGAYGAYWPQKLTVDVLKSGHDAAKYKAYTTKAFFATDHPLNPYDAGAGSYKNLFTGGDAADISTAVTLDVALANLSKVFSLIASTKMPNGVDPRFLRPRAILCSPKLYPRAVQLTNAKFIAQAAATGGGSADVEMLIKSLGFATPIMADELNGFESDTTYFVVVEQLSSSELGAIIYVDREPFAINFYGHLTQAELSRKQELEWHMLGRNAIAPGHPYLLFKVKAA